MPKGISSIRIDREKLLDYVNYDPATGAFTWRKSRAKSVVAGKRAGCVEWTGYYVLTIEGVQYQASRLAWLYVHGEEPDCRVQFRDGDPLNLRIDNLWLGDGLYKRDRAAWERRNRKLRPDTYKNRELRTGFGIGLADYQAMYDAQGGVCAICQKPETATRRGKVKMLAVDHCHGTGKVRGLLCVECNTGIGKLREDTTVLRAAIRYLETHAALSDAA